MSSEFHYRQCSRCVLDTTAKYLTFDENGVCSYCRDFDGLAKKYVWIDPKIKANELDIIVTKIKKAGKGRSYDCIIGLSGGVDSSYLAYLAKQLGLRPLAVHFDNGWNSEIAVKNIENIVTKLKIDLHTIVIDWEEFKDIQLAYFKASVVDTEVPTDQFIFAALYKTAREKKIKYILSGYNFVTEFGMPRGWNFRDKLDMTNLVNIHKRFGKLPLRTFPKIGFYQRFFYEHILGITIEEPLNLVSYIKKDIKQVIQKELGWQDYGGKHHESIFTRFYQDFILPKKFNIDKRKLHLSTLICSKQITKEDALKELANPPYPKEEQENDKQYFIKKMGLSEFEFNRIMSEHPIEHEVYGTERDKEKLHSIFLKIMDLPIRIIRKYRHLKLKYTKL